MDTVKEFFKTYVWSENISNIDNQILESRVQEIYNMLSGEVNTTWNCDAFNTLKSYDLRKDKIFDELHRTVLDRVDVFSSYHGDNSKYVPKCTNSWVNITFPGQWQEYHIHPNAHFSAVYYIKTKPNCGNIVLNSPLETMFPLPFESKEETTVTTEPSESDLYIFRSNIKHMVRKNMSEDARISIAMNFVLESK